MAFTLPPMHVMGRREPECPCPKEPCGGVDSEKVAATCEVHHITPDTTHYGQVHYADTTACRNAAARRAA